MSLTLVESFGGTVTAANLAEEGARFEVTLKSAGSARDRNDSTRA